MRFIVIILFLFFLFSCNKQNNKREEQFVLQKEYYKIDTLFFKTDTIAYVNYINEKAVSLNWGVVNNFINKSKDTLYYPNNSFLSFEKKEDYFIVSDLCGTACKYLYVAPIRSKTSGKLFLYPLADDFKNNLIAHHSDDGNLVTIENILTKKNIIIKEKFNNKIRPTSLAIDTCYFKGNTFFIRWELPSGKKKIKEINILRLKKYEKTP